MGKSIAISTIDFKLLRNICSVRVIKIEHSQRSLTNSPPQQTLPASLLLLFLHPVALLLLSALCSLLAINSHLTACFFKFIFFYCLIRYTRLDFLYLNAGIMPVTHLNWKNMFKAIFTP